MQAVFHQLDICLDRHESFVLSRAAAAAILVTAGAVWVTRAGDRHDHVLARGQRLRVGNDGAVVLMALGGARVSVASPARERNPVTQGLRTLKALYLRGMRRLAGQARTRALARLRTMSASLAAPAIVAPMPPAMS